MTDFNTAVKGVLDRLPKAVRDGLLLFVGALLTWVSAVAAGVSIPGNPLATGIVSSAAVSLAGTATLWFTKATKNYGVGA